MSGYEVIFPEALLLLGALIAIFCPSKGAYVSLAAGVGVVCAAAAACLAAALPLGDGGAFGALLVYDGTTRLARVAIAALTAIWLLWTAGVRRSYSREAVALALFAAMGGMFLSAAQDLIVTFVSLELATLPVYVLIGYRRNDVKGLEGALKFFLLSMMLTLFTLYGFSFLFGLCATTSYSGLSIEGAGVIGLLGLVLSLVGVFAKLSAVPFHFWAPDAYEGSTSWAVAFVSTVPKIGGAVAIVRLVEATAFGNDEALLVIAVVGAASMILGNLVALPQNDVRRLMAYSAIAHTGYMMLGLLAASALGSLATVAYSIVYSFASMAVLLASAFEGPAVADFNGLVKRRPGIAWGVVIALLSLIGIPPMAGFFGKLTLFTSALEAGWIGMVLLAVAMSIVSVAYYLKIVKASFFGEVAGASAPGNVVVSTGTKDESVNVNTTEGGAVGTGENGSVAEPGADKAIQNPAALSLLAFWLCVIGVVGLGLSFGLMLSFGGLM